MYRRGNGARTSVSVRSFKNKASKGLAFPHPQSCEDKYRKKDKPSRRGVLWNVFERTINITDDRNGKDDVNPAKNRTFGTIVHNWLTVDRTRSPRRHYERTERPSPG
jgi:hypothetical protein